MTQSSNPPNPLRDVIVVQVGTAAVTDTVPVSGTVTTAPPTPAAGTDKSAATSTASSVLMAANASRKGFFIKNDTTIDVWVNFGATAVATAGSGNYKIAANGGYLESPPWGPTTSAINIIAASGTPAISAREF